MISLPPQGKQAFGGESPIYSDKINHPYIGYLRLITHILSQNCPRKILIVYGFYGEKVFHS